ncbi:MAG: hypothetical protein HC843_09555 [Sphingomonadales bacterium]|nr:hypothetical protein [Sphingomonadales bacterium]
MRQGTIVTVKPDGHPLSVGQAKRQLRLEPEDTEEEEHIAELCAAAGRKVERDLGYSVLRQTCETHLDGFPRGPIWLGGGDDMTVVALRYIDSAGIEQTVAPANYVLNAVGRVAELYPAPLFSWPSTQCRPGAVVVEWQAGWAGPSDVPEDLVHAMKMLVGHWDRNREAVIVGSISQEVKVAYEELIEQFRVPFIA